MAHVQKVACWPNPQKAQRRQLRLFGWIRLICSRLLFLTMLQPIVAHLAFASCSAPNNPILRGFPVEVRGGFPKRPEPHSLGL